MAEYRMQGSDLYDRNKNRMGYARENTVFDAVNGIHPKYAPIHVAPGAPAGASRDAAAASAAHEALMSFFPGQQTMFDEQLAISIGMLTVLPGAPVTSGVKTRAGAPAHSSTLTSILSARSPSRSRSRHA